MLSEYHNQVCLAYLLWEVLRDPADTFDEVIPTSKLKQWLNEERYLIGGSIAGPRKLSDYCGRGRQRMK